EGKLYAGPLRLHFRGYARDRTGAPTFRYEVEDGKATADVAERIEPLRHAAGVGMARHFRLGVPSGQHAWVIAGESAAAARVLDSRGAATALELKTGTTTRPTTDWLILRQDGERVVALAVASAPPGARWHVRRVEGGWHVLLGIPAAKGERTLPLELRVWAPF